MSGQEIAVFAGPSLREALPPGFKLLPPAKQGDVFGVARSRPLAIGLIDGYFEQAPAVWHKEILWALSQGIHVFGAARSEEHTSELQSLMRISYAVFCLKKKHTTPQHTTPHP